jgi:hypothetical protein
LEVLEVLVDDAERRDVIHFFAEEVDPLILSPTDKPLLPL